MLKVNSVVLLFLNKFWIDDVYFSDYMFIKHKILNDLLLNFSSKLVSALYIAKLESNVSCITGWASGASN